MNKLSSWKWIARKRFAVLTALMFIAASSSAFASVDGTFEKTFQVNGPVQLDVSTHSGDVVVHNGPADSVRVVGKIHIGSSWFVGGDKRAKAEEVAKNPPIRQAGNIIHIDYVNMRDVAIDYEITVPAETKLHSRSGSGNQDVGGISGGTDLESGSGDVQLRALNGEIRVQTGSGNVRGRELNGGIRATAGSGESNLNNRRWRRPDPHRFRKHSGPGRQPRAARRCGSGDITAEGVQKNEWEVRTGSGNVRLRLPSEAAFNVDLTTSSGTLDVRHPVTTTVQGRVHDAPQKSISGQVHGGGPLLRVHTGFRRHIHRIALIGKHVSEGTHLARVAGVDAESPAIALDDVGDCVGPGICRDPARVWARSWRSVMHAFMNMGTNIIVLWPGQTYLQAGGQRAGKKVEYQYEDIEAIRDEVPLVKAVSGEIDRDFGFKVGTRVVSMNVRGVELPYGQMRRIDIEDGQQFQ